MFCQPEYSYQMQSEYQYTQPVQYQDNHLTQYHNGSISHYSPTTPPDRPSPSFRIDDILLQNKAAAMHSYGTTYPMNQHYTAFQHGHLSHGSISDREYQGGHNATLSQIPVYFRLKSNLRTESGRKCRKPRTVFSEVQLMVLEREFGEHKYLSTPQRTKLAERLNLNQTQVKTWYQNRRMKWKKETSESDIKKNKQMNTNDMKLTNTNAVEQYSANRMDGNNMMCSS